MSDSANRETKVEESVQAFAKAALEGKGWTEEKLAMLDEFPFDDFEGDITTQSYIAFGFNFDDEGRPTECGSDLITRVYTLEFFVFGKNEGSAKEIANDLKFAIDHGSSIPLLDINTAGAPAVDSLLVVGVKASKVLVDNPKPFQQHVWLTTARVQDDYFQSAA